MNATMGVQKCKTGVAENVLKMKVEPPCFDGQRTKVIFYSSATELMKKHRKCSEFIVPENI